MSPAGFFTSSHVSWVGREARLHEGVDVSAKIAEHVAWRVAAKRRKRAAMRLEDYKVVSDDEVMEEPASRRTVSATKGGPKAAHRTAVRPRKKVPHSQHLRTAAPVEDKVDHWAERVRRRQLELSLIRRRGVRDAAMRLEPGWSWKPRRRVCRRGRDRSESNKRSENKDVFAQLNATVRGSHWGATLVRTTRYPLGCSRK